MIFKFCNKCGTETAHYKYEIQCRCKPCVIASIKKAREERIASGVKPTTTKKAPKPKEIEIANPTPKRDYNLMTAPTYTGENWQNVRGQMQPTVRYVGVTG